MAAKSLAISAAAAPGLRRSLAAQAPAASFFSSQPARAVVSPAQHRVGEYGLGGRHSVSGVRCALFGGIGFLGRYVCSEMGKIGTRVRVGNRGCELERATSSVNYSCEEVNVGGAGDRPAGQGRGRRGLRARERHGRRRKSPSEWARTKARRGGRARGVPEATIVRPCTLFGWEDRLLNWFAGIAGMPGALVPLVDDGASVLQPVYAVDVAKVINQITLDPTKYAGQVVELGGPAEYTRRELAEFTFDVTKQKATLVPVPAQLADFAAGFMNLAPSPMWTRDEVALETVDVVVPPGTPNLTFADFGIAPTPIEDRLLYLRREGGLHHRQGLPRQDASPLPDHAKTRKLALGFGVAGRHGARAEVRRRRPAAGDVFASKAMEAGSAPATCRELLAGLRKGRRVVRSSAAGKEASGARARTARSNRTRADAATNRRHTRFSTMAVVGLDFGCLNAVMAQAERGGVTVLLNENSKRLNANLVRGGVVHRAVQLQEHDLVHEALHGAQDVRAREVAAEIARVPGVKFVEVDGLVGVEVMYDGEPKALSIPQCAAMMLFKMSQICADSNKGASIAEVVVSVPAWFTNSQRLAMLDACDVAGLRCLRLMHDTTATALEYGIWRSAKKAFDERSSYQVSIVDYVIGKLVVKATAWDRTLGGRDFERAHADKFEELIQPLLDRLVAPVDRALEASGTDPKDLAATEICGGGSRVASVKKVLAARLGLDASATNYGLKTTLNADECVSKGCAMQAAMLSPRFKVKEYQIYEATPFGCEALIGEFTVKGVPPASADAPSRVRVNVAHSVHGTVAISSAQLVVEVPDDEPAKKDDEKKDDAKADGEAKSEEKKDDAPAESRTARPRPRGERHAQALEAYIYKMRDDVIGDLRPFVADDAKAAFEAAIGGAEEWLYEGSGYDATKSQSRASRTSTRSVLRRVDDSERGGRDAATKAGDWLMDMLDKQGKLEQHDDPALLPADVSAKLGDLERNTKAILAKPKPIPKKEEAKAEAPPAPDATPKDDGDAKMDDASAPDVDMPDAQADKSDVDMPDAAARAEPTDWARPRGPARAAMSRAFAALEPERAGGRRRRQHGEREHRGRAASATRRRHSA
ncbi:ATP binding protein [Aureococcus anophagefferens]|nr:ATP binding protein [Aureococcus anophagefferens]